MEERGEEEDGFDVVLLQARPGLAKGAGITMETAVRSRRRQWMGQGWEDAEGMYPPLDDDVPPERDVIAYNDLSQPYS